MTTIQVEQTYSQLTLSPEEIQLDPHQPRVESSEEDFADLVASIAEQGILQPIQVEALPDGQYRIIAGSRRLAAARQLGLPSVPCLVRTTPLSSYNRLLSQLAENRVRAATDPYDEAIALKTVKVLADVEAASLQLAEVLGVVVPNNPSPQSESNQERLTRYEAYLEQLTTLMVSPEIAPQLPREIVYQDKVSGTYRLTNQALASWPQIEKACGLTKGKRLSLIRLAQVKPEVVSLVRECGLQSQTTGAFRQRLTALAGIAPVYQQGVVECLVTEGQPLEPTTLAMLAETLEQLELDGMTETIDLPRLVTLLLSTPGISAADLCQIYLKAVSNPEPELPPAHQTEDELDELMSMLGDEPTPTKPASKPSRYSLESDFEKRSGDAGGGGKPGGKGKGRGNGGQEREFEEDYGEEGGYGGGGGGLPSDQDAAAGFSLEGLEAELPPELSAELETMGLSETAQRSIATLDPADRPKVVEMLRQHPELTGKLRSIVKLVRDEGYSVEAACRECEGTKDTAENEETNPDELGLLGIQKLVNATTLLNEALDTLRECAPNRQLTQLAEPFATRLQEHALMLRQLLLEAGFEF